MDRSVTELFCFVNDFCKAIKKNFAEKLLPNSKKPTRTREITHSQILTIILLYQQSRCEDFKSFYTYYLKALYGSEFQNLPTYSRFIRLKSRVLGYLYQTSLLGRQIGCVINLLKFRNYRQKGYF